MLTLPYPSSMLGGAVLFAVRVWRTAKFLRDWQLDQLRATPTTLRHGSFFLCPAPVLIATARKASGITHHLRDAFGNPVIAGWTLADSHCPWASPLVALSGASGERRANGGLRALCSPSRRSLVVDVQYVDVPVNRPI